MKTTIAKMDKGQQYFGTRKETLKEGHHIGYYPTTFLDFPIKPRRGSTRPDELIDYFIKTYTNEGDKVLDMTCHTAETGNRCEVLNRDYYGVDLNLVGR